LRGANLIQPEGEEGLGQGRVFGGQYPGGPIICRLVKRGGLGDCSEIEQEKRKRLGNLGSHAKMKR
jgi:hypothetical protein